MERHFFDAREHTLSNGLELITIQKDTRISSIHVGIKVGAMNEKIEQKGICHFIEHMAFKGTYRRDNNKINQDLEERAGNYNAYTDYNSTVFLITSLCDELEASVDILSDILINSTFPEEEIEKERGVILAEIKTNLDDVEQYSFNKVHEIAFDISPLKFDVAGTEKTVKSFTQKELKSFYHTYYIPNNCSISIVSPFSHDKVKEMIQRYFGKWQICKTINDNIITEKNKNIEKVSHKKNIEQNTLTYLYTFHGLSRKEELALDILSHRLGESPNSVLFRALREERGLSYDVYSQMDAGRGVKTLYIYTAVAENNVWEAKKIIEDCIKGIKSKEIILAHRDIEIMKKVIKTSIASILEDSEGLGNYVLNQKLMGKNIYSFMDDLRVLDTIKEEDIYNVAVKVLREPTVHILIGN